MVKEGEYGANMYVNGKVIMLKLFQKWKENNGGGKFKYRIFHIL
jgi:hypothetical protein